MSLAVAMWRCAAFPDAAKVKIFNTVFFQLIAVQFCGFLLSGRRARCEAAMLQGGPILTWRDARWLPITTIIGLMAFPSMAFAQACPVDMDRVASRIASLEKFYSGIASDIDCNAPKNAAQRILCARAKRADGQLWTMSRLDDMASAAAYENATRTEVDRKNPPRDDAFIAARDACKDEKCLCDALIQHSNDSLGGTSPYAPR